MRLRRRELVLGMLGGPLLGQAVSGTVTLPKPVRLAIIGFDGHVDEILRVLPVLPDVRLVAVANSNSDPESAAAALKDPHVAQARRYRTAEELLAAEQLDLAAICNNDGERAAAIVACARHKVDVIAEKPLATNRADLDAVYAARKNSGIRVGMLLPMRFDPPYVAIKRIVGEGQIGEVLQIDAQKSYQLGRRPDWQKHASTYGSTILWIGIHMIDLMTWTSGRSFAEVASYQARVGFPELQDMETVTASIFRLDNGGTATLRMDYLRPPSMDTHGDARLRLAGTRGIVEFQESSGLTVMTQDKPFQTLRNLPPRGSVFLDFLQALYTRAKPGLAWEEIARANEYALAAHVAAQQHRPISMP